MSDLTERAMTVVMCPEDLPPAYSPPTNPPTFLLPQGPLAAVPVCKEKEGALGDGDVLVVSTDAIPNTKLPLSDQIDPYNAIGQLEEFGDEKPWAGEIERT